MNGVARTIVFTLVVLALGTLATASAALTELRDVPQSYIFSPPGKLTPLAAGVTYRASRFPLAVRVTPPGGGWTGAQWKANKFSPYEIELRHLTCSTNPDVCRPPYYGWVAIGRGGTSPTGPAPRVLILVMAGFSRTPSVAATVTSLRTRGHGTTYEPSVPVQLAGFTGVQFDGRLVGPRHVFVPFSPRTSKATEVSRLPRGDWCRPRVSLRRPERARQYRHRPRRQRDPLR